MTMTKPAVFVTTSWDDGHVLDHEVAQLLDRYELPGTFYVAPLNVEFERRERLDVVGVQQLGKRFEIGAHTLRHLRLPTLSDSEAREEIRAGRQWLEDTLQQSVDAFCYVGGAYREQHVQMVADEGFVLGRTVSRHSTDTTGDRFRLPTTIHAYRHWSDIAAIHRLADGDARRAARFLWCWDDLAIALFEQTLRTGGVFHLWGHSWEVDQRRDWDRLERVLQHIANHPDVCYVNNSALPLGVAA